MSFEMFNPQGLYFERVGHAREVRYIHFRKPSNKIGRSKLMDISIDTEKANTVSREHSLVEFRNGRMYISNLSNTNPTFLNNDKVIRQTEVEEGDLIGFGSKPNIVYPNLSVDQIFVYQCKSFSRSRQQNVIILDDSDDEIEVVEDTEYPEPSTSSSSCDSKSKANELEIVIEAPPLKPEIKCQSPEIALEPQQTIDIPLHIDTIEKLKDDDGDQFPEEDDSSNENVITENMLSVKILLKKLTDEEVVQWKAKIDDENSESDVEYEDKDIESEKEENVESEKEITIEKEQIEDKPLEDIKALSDSPKNDKFLNNRTDLSKSKLDIIAKSLEMREKIRSLVDDDESDDEKSNHSEQSATKSPEPTKKPEMTKSESFDKSQKSFPIFKRRISTHEKASSFSSNKKPKLEESATAKKMYKFPDASAISPEKNKDNKDPIKRRLSLSEMKNDTDSSDSMKRETLNKIIKRRMSLCPTSHPKLVSPHSNMKKKKPPPRRQTISESRFTEFDMFSKASELRMKKWGPTGKPNDVNPQKDAQKKPETIKKPQIHGELRVDKNIVSQEVKKILDPILNRPKINPFVKTVPPTKTDTKPDSNNSKNEEQLDGIKKASLVKTKFTPVTRGMCLTEAIPLTRTKPAPLRRSSSASKEAMSVSTFYEKYVKPNDVPNVNKASSVDPIPEEVIDSLNAKINMEMKKQHEQLAVETSLTINEPESPIETDDEELNLETDDEDMDRDEDTLGFYQLIDPEFGSPMKDDPRGKTKWVMNSQENDEEPVEKTYELQKFPSTPFLTSTIHVHHEKPVEDIKKILKISPIYVSPSKQKDRKRVSFNEYNLVDVVRYGTDDCPINTSKQQVAHVPPMRSSIRNPKYYESAACAELLEWDWKWITSSNELPKNWKVEPHKPIYNTLQEYKNELKTVMNVELLKKLTSKYKTISAKEKTWNFMTVKERKDEQNNHIKLVLGCDSKDLKQGTLLLLKVRDTNSITRKPIDIHFFGYVTAVNDRGELKLDTYCKELRKEKAVVKSTCLIHLRSDIKLFAVLNCIQDTPFMRLFLNPSANKMDRYEGMTSVSLEFKMTSIRLCPEQRTIIKKLSHECTKNDAEKIIFVNGCAGTGKTYMMLAAVLNLKFSLKDKRRYLICASTLSGIDEIADTLYNMPHSSALNIVRIGYRDQLIGNGRKLGINEQVQQKLNNGVKGKSYKEIQKEIIENADIILSTLKSCYDLFDYQLPIDTCFIDEANFAIDAELMILVQLNIKKMIFVGDEYQLEPTQSLVFKETRHNNSYFNRIINFYKSKNFTNAPVFTLLTQHRMNRDLFYICNKHIYNDSLTYNTINSMSTANFPFKPFSVFTLDVATSNDQKFMTDEVNLFCMKLCEILPKTVSIGIVNGFPSQRDKSKIKLDTNDRRIECLAVETIQGIEKDVIILTLRNTETYFMHNFNRINVAMTRARKALYICSNMNMILYPNEAGLFLRLKDDARDRDLYHVIQKFDFDKLYSMLRK